MRAIGADEVRTDLLRLLHEVAAGETIVITVRGEPIARLVPAGDGLPDVSTVIDD